MTVRIVRYGQEPQTGDLIFAVRVKGLGARSAPPIKVAEDICRDWSRIFPGVQVSVYDAELFTEHLRDVVDDFIDFLAEKGEGK